MYLVIDGTLLSIERRGDMIQAHVLKQTQVGNAPQDHKAVVGRGCVEESHMMRFEWRTVPSP